METETYYGAPTNAEVKPIRERLRDLYEPEDFVTVINVDTQPIKYQFASPADLETYSDYPGHKMTVQKKPPQVVVLMPGDTKLCPAYEADQMIEALIKQITIRNVQDKVEAGELDRQRATADWTDPYLQTSLIKQIFVGKKDILNMYNQEMQSSQTLAAEDLDLDKPKIGRPRKEV